MTTGTERTLSEPNPADWDACDEHETTFPKGDACPKCEEEDERENERLYDRSMEEPTYRGGEAASVLAEEQAEIQRTLK